MNNMRQRLTLFLLAGVMSAAAQVKTEIKTMNQAGPYAVSAPLGLDTVDVKGQKFDEASLLNGIALTSPATGRFEGQVLPSLPKSKSVGLLTFYVNNRDYLKGTIEVNGPKHYKLFVDGEPAAPERKLAPDHHTSAIRSVRCTRQKAPPCRRAAAALRHSSSSPAVSVRMAARSGSGETPPRPAGK